MLTKVEGQDYLSRALRGELLDDIRIIDHHGHLGGFRDATLEEEVKMIIDVMDGLSVDQGVVFACDFGNQTKLNDMIIKAINMYPERLLGYAFVNTIENEKLVISELERCAKEGLRGLKLHSSYHPTKEKDFSSKALKPIWDFCAEHRWPVIIHGQVYPLPYEYPDTVFIKAHGIDSIFNSQVVEMMKECQNFYWCTSATMTAMGAIERAVSLFGADRLLFGSDFPLNNMATRMGAVLAADISDEDKRKILGENVVNLLGI